MRQLLLFILFCLPSFSSADESWKEDKNVKAKLETRNKFNPRSSHGLFTYGFEGLKYQLPFEFQGDKKSFTSQNREMWGGRIGAGFEVYLGLGFITSSRAEGYYMGTLFKRTQTADPEYSVSISGTKDSGSIWGGDLVQSLGFLFDFKSKNPFLNETIYLTVEPFVEVGVGVAEAYNRKSYYFDTGTCVGCFQENYQHGFRDTLTTSRIGVGVNFVSVSGYFLTLKATEYDMDISKRKTTGFSKTTGGASTSLVGEQKNINLRSTMVYSIGGGLKF